MPFYTRWLQMILEISEMINLIEQHFQSDWGSEKILTVGGVIGTSLFKHAVHACMRYVEFEKILVLDGCQDYIGLLRKPVFNYQFYLNLFSSIEIPSLDELNRPFYRSMLTPKPGYQTLLNEKLIVGYDALIVNNAHLIPKMYLNAICEYFRGKVLLIVDTLDLAGESYYMNIPTLYDTLSKQSTMCALARSMYDIETRAIDRKVKCDFRRIKMNKRSIGRIDTNQYVTNSEEILQMIQEKQLQSQPRRNQKLIVSQEHVQYFKSETNDNCVIGPRTMFSIVTASRPLMKLRIHSSASIIFANFTYMDNRRGIYVKPANILSIQDAIHHRFHSLVFVLGDEPMTNRMWYSLMKIANTISVVKY